MLRQAPRRIASTRICAMHFCRSDFPSVICLFLQIYTALHHMLFQPFHILIASPWWSIFLCHFAILWLGAPYFLFRICTCLSHRGSDVLSTYTRVFVVSDLINYMSHVHYSSHWWFGCSDIWHQMHSKNELTITHASNGLQFCLCCFQCSRWCAALQ